MYSSAGISTIIQNETEKKQNGETFPEYIAKVHEWLSLWSQILPSGTLNNPNFVEGTMKDIKEEALEYLEELEQYYEKLDELVCDDSAAHSPESLT